MFFQNTFSDINPNDPGNKTAKHPNRQIPAAAVFHKTLDCLRIHTRFLPMQDILVQEEKDRDTTAKDIGALNYPISDDQCEYAVFHLL